MTATDPAEHYSSHLADQCETGDGRAAAYYLACIANELRTANLIAVGSAVAVPCSEASSALNSAFARLGYDGGQR